MKKALIRNAFTCCLLLFTCITAFSQDRMTVTGKITDRETGEPLSGVSISVINSAGLGTFSTKEGLYTIKVEAYRKLLFSYIGYDTVEVLVKDKDTVNVLMKKSEAKAIDEVVVTGYTAQKKINVTGAVTSVDMDELRKSAATASIVNTLAGNVPGILAMQTSGQPGKDISNFWVRGIATFGASSSALVLVDGFERDINEVNIDDIKTFTVLKDASATAMYGAKGANGVILITTKHGTIGKTNINAKAEAAYNTRTITPKFVDGNTYANLLNEAQITRDKPAIYSPVELEILRLGLDPDLYPNVDWSKKILKDGAMTKNANLSFSGGGTTARYYVSGSYLDEEGMYKTDDAIKKDYNTNADYQKWTYRLNTDVNVTKTTILKLGAAGSLIKRNSPGLGDNDVWGELFGYTPIRTPIYYSNGYVPAVGTGNQTNPWVAATQTGFNETWDNNIQTNVTLDQDFDFLLKGLKFEGSFGYDTYNTTTIERHKWPEQWQAERLRDADGNLIFKQWSDPSPLTQASSSDGSRREFLIAMLNYSHAIKYHNIGVDVRYNQESSTFTQNIGDDLKKGVPKKNQGLAGHVYYNWKSRYYADFNFGYTGSENFAPGHQFGFFPAVSGAWNIAEEDFIKNNFKWINLFKVRYSWGRVGNDNLGDDNRFPYLYTIAEGLGGYQWAEFGLDKNYGGLGYSQVASPYVTWEIAKKQDLGLDLSLWHDNFSMTLDAFKEERTGIYMQRNFLPNYIGLTSAPSANVGAVRSKGIDGNFTVKHQFNKVNVTMRGNITLSKNEVLDRDEEESVYPYQLQKGYRVNQTRGLIALGLFKDYNDIRNSPTQTYGDYQPGDIKYKDVNGDGVINDDDIVAVGSTSTPNLVYGVGASVSWKGFDVDVLFQGAGKSSFFIYGKTVYAFSEGEWGNILQGMVEHRWISADISGDPATENPDAPYPRLSYNGNANNYRNSTYWLRNGEYLRLKHLELGYTLPKEMLNKIHVNSIRIYCIGTNLLTWAPFKLWDPETADPRGETYPLAKSVTLGLTIGL
ncbi:SusC/RagA family protein [Arachidicoccus ginsenosidimutans]|uniref:SusC/RagA family TonB-linked outer membrane protein n=1 Tax=Arachidicoccus sp. BS20 TaxID=1850526 RepID=UPI0007F0AE2A|nr:TonB-dependent receptor [Arachidicoccus sp. BS20]ANI88894.1 SusC/RagA family protein [Arachidicoccus sp. BS20]